MQKNLLIIAAIVVLIGIVALVKSNTASDAEKESANPAYSTYTNEELGFLFNYRTGTTGYTIDEPFISEGERVKKILVLQSPEARAFAENPLEGTESPATITILIFDNAEGLSPRAWANANPMYSNITLASDEVVETTLGGVSAIRYTVDGLYMIDTVVVTWGAHTYVFNGAFMEKNSDLRKDFLALLETVMFLPTES